MLLERLTFFILFLQERKINNLDKTESRVVMRRSTNDTKNNDDDDRYGAALRVR